MKSIILGLNMESSYKNQLNQRKMKLKKRARKIASKYYHMLKKLTYSDNDVFLIYSMGKVGSSSIYTSLKNQKRYSDIYHVHFLSNNWLDKILPELHESFHSNIKLGYDILNFIEKHPQKKLRIITLVREPVMRGISDLFQNWRHLYDDIEEIDNTKLKERVENIKHDYTLNWFDTEFLEYLNVDIYSLPFDKEKGYAIYDYDRFDILLIKLEALNEIGASAMAKFLAEEFKLSKANTSALKKTNEKYNFLKKNVKMDDTKLTNLYASKYVQHFYSENEIEGFKKTWSKKN